MENIKTWYQTNFPTDKLGADLNEVTFDEVFNCLDRRKDLYEFIGVTDSLIRERLFEKLAELAQMPYSYIYDQWLLG
jgi:hypothetical protein